jgi:hypothetical protein
MFLCLPAISSCRGHLFQLNEKGTLLPKQTVANLVVKFFDEGLLLCLQDVTSMGTSYFRGLGWDWVHLVRLPLTGLLYPRRMTDDKCGAFGRMIIGRGNQTTLRKPTPVTLFPHHKSPHDLAWDRTRTTAYRSLIQHILECWSFYSEDKR